MKSWENFLYSGITCHFILTYSRFKANSTGLCERNGLGSKHQHLQPSRNTKFLMQRLHILTDVARTRNLNILTGLILVNNMQSPPPLPLKKIRFILFVEIVAQSPETNEKSTFWFLRFLVFDIWSILDHLDTPKKIIFLSFQKMRNVLKRIF